LDTTEYVRVRMLPFDIWFDTPDAEWDARERVMHFRLSDAVDAGLVDALTRAQEGETVEIVLPPAYGRGELMLVVEPEPPVWGGVSIDVIDGDMAWAGAAGIGSHVILALLGRCMGCEMAASPADGEPEDWEHTCR